MSTIKDVARRADVSTSTVSRALSGKIFVEEATRERVFEAIKALNYIPNHMAKSLKEGRSRTLALVLPDITNPFYPKLVKCMEKSASDNGYSMILYDTGEDKKREIQYFEMLRTHYVDGIILVSTSDDISHILKHKEKNIPMIIVNREFDIGIPCVSNDNQNGACTMVQYLIGQGHERICCMIGDLSMQRYRQRYEGCIQAFSQNNIFGYEKYFVTDVESVDDAHERTSILLSLPNPPTAFFASTDMFAIGIYSAIYESRFSIPADISVVGFDNNNISQHMIPPLTTYNHPVDQIAKASIEKLLLLIEGKELARPTIQITNGTMVIRKSVKNRN